MVLKRPSVPSSLSAPHQDHDSQINQIQRAVGGDREALNSILTNVGPCMLRAVRTILGDDAKFSEDVFQDSLLDLVAALPSFRHECGLRHFGYRIAARAAVRARRKNRKRLEKLRALAVQEALLRSGVDSPGTMAAAERRKAILRHLLDELPQAQAETLTLRVILGHSLVDIALATGVPVNTVRSRLRLAKEALRQRIESDPKAKEIFEVES